MRSAWVICVLGSWVAASPVLAGDAAAASDQGIQPYSVNPRYWQYQGKPVLLLGGSKDDSLFQIPDLESHLDEMAQVGANYIRNTMSDRPDHDFEVKAFARLENGKYDLDRWNDEYWSRFENLLRLTHDRGIIVQIEVWDRFDHSTNNWLGDPYNPANNVNYTFELAGLAPDYPDHAGKNKQPFFFTTPAQRDNTIVLPYQERFVAKMLEHSLAYDHVLYCMDNETSADEAWGVYWARFIQEKAAAAGRMVYLTEMWDNWDLESPQHRHTLDRPDRYAFVDVSQNNHQKGQAHWDHFQWARQYVSAQPRPLNTVKTYGADGGKYGTSRDGVERFWRHLIGGAAAMRFHRPDSGLGLAPEAMAAIAAGRKLASLVTLWEMEPANELLGDLSDNEAYASARPGLAYALYFPDGGSVTLDTSAARSDVLLHWIDVGTGQWGPRQLLKPGKNTRLKTPGSGHWALAIVPAPPDSGASK